LEAIVNEIQQSFSFRNLSVDTLTYVYENTLVTPESRKKLGIHSTPSYVADYVLAQLPFENILRSRWKIFDPMCGHGIFLIAAMRRMRSLMPKDWGGQKRHEFFAQCLFGTEIDSFAIEVALMCLTLADFPEADGWKIKSADIFKGELLENTCSKTTILVGNPPFEIMKVGGRARPKPAELLKRALPELPNGSLMGMILPKAFLDSLDYRRERDLLLNNFDVLSLTALPDKIFRYADSETSIIVAQKGKRGISGKTVFKEVRDADKDIFKSNYQVTWEDIVPYSYFSENRNNILSVPFMREVWEYLRNVPTLGDISDIRIGVQYEPSLVKGISNEIIRDEPFENSAPAITEVSEGFYQFIALDTKYISTDPKLYRSRARGAWNLPWNEPKVVVPAGRESRGPWRSAAAIDKQKRLVTRHFYCVWTNDENISVETIAAVINSPLAQAFIYSHSSQRGTPKRVYERIPFPNDLFNSDKFISSLVNQYLEFSTKRQEEEAINILLQIDAEILKLYNLPPKLERKILNLFWGKQRPVPSEFIGYILPENESWIPLHVYLSEPYKNATPHRILEKFPSVNSELIEFLKTVGTED
jgi:hypothetical protein